MIESFTEAWFANQDVVRSKFREKHPECYEDVVRIVVGMLAKSLSDYEKPDPTRIHEIDDGSYQGALVYVIGADGYQPSCYWYVMVGYGSCSGCDTLESIRDYSHDPPTDEQVADYMTLALHIIQGLKKMHDEAV